MATTCLAEQCNSGFACLVVCHVLEATDVDVHRLGVNVDACCLLFVRTLFARRVTGYTYSPTEVAVTLIDRLLLHRRRSNRKGHVATVTTSFVYMALVRCVRLECRPSKGRWLVSWWLACAFPPVPGKFVSVCSTALDVHSKHNKACGGI